MSRQHKTGFVQTSYAAELLFYAALNFAPCLKEQEQCLDKSKQAIYFLFFANMTQSILSRPCWGNRGPHFPLM